MKLLAFDIGKNGKNTPFLLFHVQGGRGENMPFNL